MFRTIRKGSHGPRVKHLQKAANGVLGSRKFPWRRVDPDGAAGRKTFDAIHMAGWLMGLSDRELGKISKGKVTRRIFDLITNQRPRSAQMQRRDRARRDEAAKLRKKHKWLIEHPQPDPDGDGLATFDGVTVAAWFVPWLEKSRAAGWNGTVVSGYRDPAYSESLCLAMCGAPSCPGRCAGRVSNHSGKDYPAGAIDVTDYTNFGAIQPRIGSPLHNILGAADPVHFSVNGN